MESNDTIQELIAHKNFEDLSSFERTLVLANISEEQYLLQREIVVSMAEITKEDRAILHPSPAIKHAVYQRVDLNEKEESGIIAMIVAFLNRPLPAYSLAVPLLLLLFVIPWMMRWEESPKGLSEVITPDPIIDTVYITKEVPFEVEVIREVKQVVKVPVVRYVERSRVSIDYNEVSFTGSNKEYGDALIEAEARFSDQLDRIGKAASENENLEQFLTGVH